MNEKEEHEFQHQQIFKEMDEVSEILKQCEKTDSELLKRIEALENRDQLENEPC
jgi:hypothetical protein